MIEYTASRAIAGSIVINVVLSLLMIQGFAGRPAAGPPTLAAIASAAAHRVARQGPVRVRRASAALVADLLSVRV